MGTCLSKKKGSSISSPLAGTTAPAIYDLNTCSENGVTISKPSVETVPEIKLKKVQEKKEIFIIKHRKSHDDRERHSKCLEPAELMGGRVSPPAGNMAVGVRTLSCTKEEVDAILIQCGRLSRNSSGKAATSASAAYKEHRRRYSGSKRSFDFDHCDNNTISTEEDHNKANTNDINDLSEDDRMVAAEKRHRQYSRPSSRERRRTPSRERDQKQRSSSRERRVSRSPGRRSWETTTHVNSRNNSNTSSRPEKMVSVPATVSSLVMDKSNNGSRGGESAATIGIKRITVKRNVGAASPRSQSPARANRNAANTNKVLSENQQLPSLSRNSSRKAEESPYRRNPPSEVEPNSLAFPLSNSTANNNNSSVHNRPKKDTETEANQKPNASRTALDKGGGVNCKAKVQQEEDVKVQTSMTDNIVVKTVIPAGVDYLKPQTLTRSRSSRDLDLNPEVLLIPPQSYTSLLLKDIQNFHQKNTPPVSLPACVTNACSILEAVADLTSNTSSNFSGTKDRTSAPGFQSSRNEYNVPLNTNNNYGKRVQDTKGPIVESELVVNDDLMEPSLHKYVTVDEGGSLGGVDMENQESSGSNSFTFSGGQQHCGISSSSWGPSSADSKDSWNSRLKNSRVGVQKSPLGLEGRVTSEAGCNVDEAMKKLNKKRDGDHQHGSGMRRGRLSANKVLHTGSVVTAAAST